MNHKFLITVIISFSLRILVILFPSFLTFFFVVTHLDILIISACLPAQYGGIESLVVLRPIVDILHADTTATYLLVRKELVCTQPAETID